MQRLALSVFPVVLVACASPEAVTPSSTAAGTSTGQVASAPTGKATVSAPPSAAPSAIGVDGDAPYRCDVAKDCYISCRLGAVNRAWYEAAKLPECKDGCQQGTSDVKCEDHVCVAYAGTKREDGCTKRPIPRE